MRDAEVRQRFGDVDAADSLCAGEVGDGAGDAQDAVVAAGGEAHGVGGVGQELDPAGIGLRDGVEQFALRLGIGAHALAVVALSLDRTRFRDARRDVGTAFGWRRQREILRLHRRHLDMDVYAVE